MDEQPESSAPPQPSIAGQDWLFALVLALATFAAYQPAWRGGFLWDDEAHVTRPELRSLNGLKRIWLQLGATQQYYPLTHSVFWVEHRLWGDETAGYHLVNIALHVAASLLAWRLLLSLGVPGAKLAAALFALHPVQVESVAWISELKNTLSGVFCLASAMLYMRFDRTRRSGDYNVALGLFIVGLACKTVIATLPLVLLVILWWKRGRVRWGTDVLPLLKWLAIGLAAGAFTAWVERRYIGAVGTEYDLSPIQRVLIAGRALCFYLSKLLWPARLIFIYPRWDVSAGAWWQYLYPLGAALALGALWRVRAHARGPLAAALIYAITLGPVLGFVNVYPFRYSFVADHFQYLASLSVFALIGAGVGLLVGGLQPAERRVGAGICLALLAGLGALSGSQSEMYRGEMALYTAIIEDNPACWLAYSNRGITWGSAGRYGEAIRDLDRAIELKPDYVAAYTNRGAAFDALRRHDRAIEDFSRAIALQPDYAEGYLNRSNSYKGVGRYELALSDLNHAILLRPDLLPAYNNRASAYLLLGDYERAWADVQQCRRLGGTPMPALVQKLTEISGESR